MRGRWLAVPVALALSAPATAKEAARRAAALESDVGVTVEFAGHAHEQVEQMAAAGIGWIRADLAWSHAEREPGQYDFSAWHRLVVAAESKAIRVLLILDYGNALASTEVAGRGAREGGEAAAIRREDLSAWILGPRPGRSGTSPTCRASG